MNITSEMIAQATKSFLAKGGQIERIQEVGVSSEWIHSNFMNRLNDAKSEQAMAEEAKSVGAGQMIDFVDNSVAPE